MNDPLLKLSQRLGYKFQDEEGARRALTHRSAGKSNYERLEFLGDSILNFVIAEYLYQEFPTVKEGVLSRLRAKLVRERTLADIARQFKLSEFLVLGPGEMKSGGFRRDSILSDVVEALIGQIYQESGLEVARQCILDWMGDERLQKVNDAEFLKDPKTRLQELMQSQQTPLPKYEVLNIEGKAHDQTFTVQCKVSQIEQPEQGVGSSRRIAEQEAAKKLLAKLEEKS